MVRLPIPGSDSGQWGDILNNYLSQSHTSDGKLKTDSVTAAQLAAGAVKTAAIADSTITTTKLADDAVTTSKLADSAITNAKLDAPTKASLASADAAIQDADPRLTDARTPSLHAASHASAGSDPITVAQSQITNLTTDLAGKAPTSHPHTANAISDSTAVGRSLITATDVAAAQSALSLSSTYVALPLGLQYRLYDAVESAPLTVDSVIIIGAVDGVPYARTNTGGGGLYRSDDDGATWQLVSTALAYAIVSTGDGEVIINSGSLRKSSGWAVNPITATWTTVLSTVASGAAIIQSNLEAHENYVIAAEYGNADARYVYLSTDHGATFAPVLDLDVLTGNPSIGHWHAVCIDPWHTGANPRLWASHGDGPLGVYYSDDLGSNWTQYADDWQPMPMIATPNGIVTATDQANPDGVWLIPRNLGPRKLLHRIRAPFWNGSLLGFGNSAARDPRDPSRVVIVMQGDQQTYFTTGNPARVFVSDGYSATEVYQTLNTATVGVSGATQWQAPPAITKTGRFLASYNSTAGKWTVTGNLRLGALTSADLDQGNALAGKASGRTSIAIGSGTTISSSQSVVIGSNAATTTQTTDSGVVIVGEEALARHVATAVGFQASAALQGAAFGNTAKAEYEAATAVGHDAIAGAINGTAIGKSARSGTSAGTAVGKSANASGGGSAVGSSTWATGASAVAIGGGGTTASGSESVAIGTYETRSLGSGSTAIGRNARAMNHYTVALGYNTTTTAESQVAIGTKHIEYTELAADPSAPAVDQARLYVKDNGAGRTQLCVRFATGAVQVIATEP